ncbi:MAG: phosphate acyltransferase PlsX [candidate division WOR-3 bacterium]|nr:phosphate acyltransferase PlsX [candidate division WOR-3 bacterium]
MKIAVDVMGGNYAPRAPIEGAKLAYKELKGLIQIYLVGDRELIKKFSIPEDFKIVDADQIVEPHELPMEAFRKKKNSSLAISVEMQKKGEVQVSLSAGNTGAAVAFSILSLGRLKGIDRPALATFFPTKKGRTLVLDVGANSNVKAINLRDFGIMGSLYLEKVYKVKNPSVGLLSMGEEETKGGRCIKEGHNLLSETDINFIGNIEGHDILEGKSDVVVCDGFTGNAILKFGESLVNFVTEEIKEGSMASIRTSLGGLLMKPVFKSLMEKVNYEEYGGAVLLGMAGITVVSHGKSNEKAIKNAILSGYKYYDLNVNSLIMDSLGK